MPSIPAAAAQTEIGSGRLRPLYVFRGEDEPAKAHLVDAIVATLDEDLRPFNLLRLHAADATTADGRGRVVDALVSAARTFPMMAPRRVVVLHDAERILFPKGKDDDEGPAPARAEPAKRGRKVAVQVDPLEAYLEQAEPMTTVVFVCGAWNDGRRYAKLLTAHAAIVTLGSPETVSEAVAWVLAQAKAAGVKMDQAAARSLVERSGLDITCLRPDFERVVLYGWGEPAITAAHVTEAIVPRGAAVGEFAIARMIEGGRVRDALSELAHLLDGGAVPVMLLGMLRAAAERFPSPRVPGAIDAIFRTDLALKSSGGDPRVLLERLVVELSGAGSRR